MKKLLILGFWLAAGCAGPGLTPSEATVEDLFVADRAFNDEVAAADDRASAWAGWFAEDGAQLAPGLVVRGRASILELMGPMLADTTVSLTWEPDYGEISASGDLGFTTGRYEQRRTIGDSTLVAEGRYVSIWRLTADGEWRVAMDLGVPDGP